MHRDNPDHYFYSFFKFEQQKNACSQEKVPCLSTKIMIGPEGACHAAGRKNSMNFSD